MGHDNLFVSITFQALEIKLTDSQRGSKGKPKYISIVIKRGKFAREESPRYEYTPLDTSDPNQMRNNRENYLSILRMNGQDSVEGGSFQSDDSDSISLSTTSEPSTRAST
jgi:hypothetical protein